MKTFNELCEVKNVYRAWYKFRRGKVGRADVVRFERDLEENLFSLSEDLLGKVYKHGAYEVFYVRDPKFRVIHKATVRDRVVHQMLYDELYPLLNVQWFFDSYSCRTHKGTHKAIQRVWLFVGKANKNFTQEAWILHGDVKDFFGSVDHKILFQSVARHIQCSEYLELVQEIIGSMESSPGKGMPLGNLTSQIFSNAYLHTLDHFAKHTLRVKCYTRYNDDFFVVSESREYLKQIGRKMQFFLADQLLLSIPDEKISLRCLSDGVDVLGSVFFPYGQVPRRRVSRNAQKVLHETSVSGYTTLGWKRACSYIGLLGHTKSFLLRERLRLSFYKQ